MPDNSALYNKYFKADDVRESARVLTVKRVDVEEVGGNDGKPKEKKEVLYFEEDDRGCTLNKTRRDVIIEIAGSPNNEKWLGKKVKLVFDPNVKYGTKKVGGIALVPA